MKLRAVLKCDVLQSLSSHCSGQWHVTYHVYALGPWGLLGWLCGGWHKDRQHVTGMDDP
jgi:hypothetical protein